MKATDWFDQEIFGLRAPFPGMFSPSCQAQVRANASKRDRVSSAPNHARQAVS
jgi:hypothetical protein